MIRKQTRPLVIFLLFSLLFHLGVFTSLVSFKVTPPPPPHERVEVEFSDEELRPPADDTHSAPSDSKSQIVDQKKQLNEEVDANTKLLSAFDQKVLKQTRANQSGEFKNTAQKGAASDGQKDGDKKALEHGKDRAQPTLREAGELPKLKDLSPKFSLTPGPKNNAENGEASQTDDYLKDVQSGLQTLLSTREFVYFSYYSRIKDSLRQHWEPNVREKVKIIYRQGRSIASAKDRVTQLLVTLDSNGALIKVEVLSPSGVEDLDKAAVDAFRSAAPFPNPPKGMVEADGTIKIRWDFVLEA